MKTKQAVTALFAVGLVVGLMAPAWANKTQDTYAGKLVSRIEHILKVLRLRHIVL